LPDPIQEKLSIDQLIAIWSKAVDTQMHFNEMSAKSRQLGLTFVAAALGIGVVMLGQGDDFTVSFNFYKCAIDIHITVLLILAALLALVGVRKLDLEVYHRMLRGAVTFGEDFENQYLRGEVLEKLNKGMTEAISHYSRHDDASSAGSPKVYSGSNTKSAEEKVRSFYSITIGFLLISALLIFIVTNSQRDFCWV